MEFKLKKYYDLMHTTTKELGYRVNREIKNICIEISRGNKIIVERQVVKICEDYVRSLLLI
jgi:hypothetical protein